MGVRNFDSIALKSGLNIMQIKYNVKSLATVGTQ